MGLLTILRWSQELLAILRASFKKITAFIIPEMSYNVFSPFQKTILKYTDILKSVQKISFEEK